MIDIITNYLNVWSSAQIRKVSVGRGGKGKLTAYGIKKLRELILELAVSGKLVAQDPNDETAEDLLKKIIKEKERLVRLGEVKNRKTEIDILKVDGLFELPAGWVWVRLGSIGNIFNGNSINESVKEANYTNVVGGRPFIATKDVGYGWDELDYKNGVSIPVGDAKFSVAHKGAVLICAEGGSAGKKCGIANEDICFGNKLFAIELFGNISSDYILANYLSPTFFKKFSGGMTGIIGGISTAKFEQILLPLPPAAEQQRIVTKLAEMMSLCNQLEKQQADSLAAQKTLVENLLGALTSVKESDGCAAAWQRIAKHFDALFTTEDNIDQLKQTILQLAVMGKLVPQDPNDEPASELLKKIQKENERGVRDGGNEKQKLLPKIRNEEMQFQLPSSWVYARLENVSKKITDGEHLSPNKATAGVMLLTAKHVLDDGVTTEDPQYVKPEDAEKFRLRCDPREGDVLICSRGTIGRCCVVDVSDYFCLMGSVILVRPSEGLDPNYLNIYLKSNFGQAFIRGVTKGMAVNALYLKDVKLCPLALPPHEEQLRIVARVDELMAVCDALKARIQSLQTIQVNLADAVVGRAVASKV